MDSTCYPNSQLPLPGSSGGGSGSSSDSPGGVTGIADQLPANNRLSGDANQALQDRVNENRPPEIGYATEAEALAAAERREREAYQSELARQQNELERQRREEAAAAAETEAGLTTRQQGLEKSGPRPTGERQFSAVSGYTGDNQKLLDLETDFLRAVFWEERNNKPCYLKLNDAVPLNQEESPRDYPRWHECTPGIGNIQNNRYVSVPEGNAIGRIEVCSSFNNNERLKGIRVFSDRINEDGSTTYVPGASQTAEMNNCRDDWHQAVLCPSGTVGTGVVVHYDGTARDNLIGGHIVGLQLACRGIAVD